jgi:hypothetical protein
MVMSRMWIPILLAGCLGKPAAPGAGVGDDANSDGAGNGCPAGAMPFPSDLVLRPQTAIADLDRDGDDDVFVWGRETNGNGRASVFGVLGREPLALGCYDLALPLGDVEPLDVWVGEATGDANPDVLVASRAQDTYPIHLYRGLAGGGVDPIPDIQAPLASIYGTAVGGTLANPEPVFVVAYAVNGVTEVIFGGLNEPYAGLRVTAGLEHDVFVRDNGAPPGALELGQLEELVVQGPGDPQRLLAVAVSDVVALDNVARDAGSTRFRAALRCRCTVPARRRCGSSSSRSRPRRSR